MNRGKDEGGQSVGEIDIDPFQKREETDPIGELFGEGTDQTEDHEAKKRAVGHHRVNDSLIIGLALEARQLDKDAVNHDFGCGRSGLWPP